MDFLVIPLLSALVAAVTLVSGFGLGTVLMPAFAIFFPIEIAVAATAVVHFANNLFKLALVGKLADRAVVLRFGLPAAAAALLGAALMLTLAEAPAIAAYRLGPVHASITWLKLTIAVLLATLAALELHPAYHRLSFSRRALPVGGLLSGFFGGISGMQGALRAPFLLRAGLTKEAFVGTANVISAIVDAVRIAVYAAGLAWMARSPDYAVLTSPRTLALIAAACIAGFLGSFLGARFLRKITLAAVRTTVAVLLFLVAAALAAGIL